MTSATESDSVAAVMTAPSDLSRVTAFGLFLDAAGRVNLALGGGLSAVAAIVLWKIAPNTPVPLWTVALAGLLALVAFSALIMALRAAVKLVGDKPAASVIAVHKPYPPYKHCHAVLIVRWSPSAALPVGSAVLVAFAEEQCERELGVGTVRRIQADCNAVVTIDIPHEGVDQYIDRLLVNGDLVSKIRIGAVMAFQHLPLMGGASSASESSESAGTKSP